MPNSTPGFVRCAHCKAIRGKYYKRILKEGTNVVALDPDIAKAFPSSAAVIYALRKALKTSQFARPPAGRTRSKSARAG